MYAAGKGKVQTQSARRVCMYLFVDALEERPDHVLLGELHRLDRLLSAEPDCRNLCFDITASWHHGMWTTIDRFETDSQQGKN